MAQLKTAAKAAGVHGSVLKDLIGDHGHLHRQLYPPAKGVVGTIVDIATNKWTILAVVTVAAVALTVCTAGAGSEVAVAAEGEAVAGTAAATEETAAASGAAGLDLGSEAGGVSTRVTVAMTSALATYPLYSKFYNFGLRSLSAWGHTHAPGSGVAKAVSDVLPSLPG
jgi:hypothetical protein